MPVCRKETPRSSKRSLRYYIRKIQRSTALGPDARDDSKSFLSLSFSWFARFPLLRSNCPATSAFRLFPLFSPLASARIVSLHPNVFHSVTEVKKRKAITESTISPLSRELKNQKKSGCKRTRCNCVRDTGPRHAYYIRFFTRTFHPYRTTRTVSRKNRERSASVKTKAKL